MNAPITDPSTWMRRCIDLAAESAASGGGPFGALVVRDGVLIAGGSNAVTLHNDPTAHAEVQAIRIACKALDDYRLAGCDLYASTEPCPMCLAAAYWARLDRVYYAATRFDAAEAGFDDSRIYDELGRAEDARTVPFVRIMGPEGQAPFAVWKDNANKRHY
jgi:guanine deaminase